MRSVKTANTLPELAIRKIVFGLGGRYRLHAAGLPGKPDLVFPGKRKAIFVHGCYWHGHQCPKGRLPRSRLEYWGPKIEANKERDKRQVRQLRRMGWSVLTVWQCELAKPAKLQNRIAKFLELRTPNTKAEK